MFKTKCMVFDALFLGILEIMNDYKPTSAHIHRERGRCCKSLCLHCPYGYTTEHLSFVFEKLGPENMSIGQDIIDAIQPDGVAAMLLSEGFGATKKLRLLPEDLENYRLFYLKEYLCGLLRIDSEVFLISDFNDQGIDLDLVQSHFQQA